MMRKKKFNQNFEHRERNCVFDLYIPQNHAAWAMASKVKLSKPYVILYHSVIDLFDIYVEMCGISCNLTAHTHISFCLQSLRFHFHFFPLRLKVNQQKNPVERWIHTPYRAPHSLVRTTVDAAIHDNLISSNKNLRNYFTLVWWCNDGKALQMNDIHSGCMFIAHCSHHNFTRQYCKEPLHKNTALRRVKCRRVVNLHHCYKQCGKENHLLA